jgi:hypothetical protein
VLDRYKGGASKYTDHKNAGAILPVETSTKDLLEDDILSSITRIDLLSENHPAVKLVLKRKIPKDKWHLLYFAPRFKKYTNSVITKFREPFVDEHPRMIIPLFTPAGKCFAFQGRAYGPEEPKYYIIKVDETQEKIFGLERVDYGKHIYVVEGPIDSLFLPNCIAVSGSSFDTPTVRQIMTNCTIVMDNEPRNKDIVKQMKKYIDLGYSVCMYPDTVTEKDINDMVLSGRTQEQILDLINTNTFTGMEAQLKFTKWSKV